MQSRFKLRMSMETQLRRALENEEFELFYQPQIAVATGQVTGAEALIR
jgi:sensor c-di-GMP phosphodiesterase-like protein